MEERIHFATTSATEKPASTYLLLRTITNFQGAKRGIIGISTYLILLYSYYKTDGQFWNRLITGTGISTKDASRKEAQWLRSRGRTVISCMPEPVFLGLTRALGHHAATPDCRAVCIVVCTRLKAAGVVALLYEILYGAQFFVSPYCSLLLPHDNIEITHRIADAIWAIARYLYILFFFQKRGIKE